MPDIDDDFKNDPEAGGGKNVLRLPFALCKQQGIKIEDWWTPRDAWEALRENGAVKEPSEEMKEFYRQRKKERQKEYRKTPLGKIATERSRQRSKIKKAQLANPEHNVDKSYVHKDGYIAGAVKGNPMTFEQADSGNCNPYYHDNVKGKTIGYQTNCQTCVATYIARRKGYDVRALPNLNNRNIDNLAYNVSLAYKDKSGNHPKTINVRNLDDAYNKLVAQGGKGELVALRFSWAGRNSGHIVIVDNLKAGGMNARIYDPQTDTVYDHGGIGSFLKRARNYQVMDLTDCDMDETYCDRIFKGVKK